MEFWPQILEENSRKSSKIDKNVFFLSSSFSELRRSLALCFGQVGEEVGQMMWIFENLTWISPFWSSGSLENTFNLSQLWSTVTSSRIIHCKRLDARWKGLELERSFPRSFWMPAHRKWQYHTNKVSRKCTFSLYKLSALFGRFRLQQLRFNNKNHQKVIALVWWKNLQGSNVVCFDIRQSS